MATLLGPDNAIAYAQVRLQGGLRGTLLIGGICLVLLGGLAGMQVVAQTAVGRPASFALRDWPQGLVFLQVLFLLVIGPVRVTAAVRADVNSRMLESHRLMPMTPAGVVAGYATGGAWTAVVLGAATFAFGLVCCLGGGAEASSFVLANVALAAVAVCGWVVSVHLALAGRFGVIGLAVVGFFAVSVNGPAELMPGLSVLTAPVLSRGPLVLGNATLTAAGTVVGLVGLAAVAAISYRAAMRLYRMPGAIGLNAPLGLALLAVWVGLSVLGMAYAGVFGLRQSGFGSAPAEARMVGTIVVAMLVAGLPMGAAAKTAERRERTGEGPAGAVDWDVWATAAGAVGLVVIMVVVTATLVWGHSSTGTDYAGYRTRTTAGTGDPVVWSAAVVVASVVGLAFVLRLAYVRVDRAWLIAGIWLLVTWLVPLIVDAATSTRVEGGFGPVGALSPIGALAEVWGGRKDQDPRAGIGLQFVVAAVPAVLYATARMRRRQPAVVAGG